MLNPINIARERTLSVPRLPLEVIIDGDAGSHLSLILPPLEDIIEMRELQTTHFSLRESVDEIWRKQGEYFLNSLKALEEKTARFSNSPTFYNRLANLAEMAGLRDKEYQFLQKAVSIKDENFFMHRIGDNFVASGKNTQAQDLFSKLDLEVDVYANIRMSYFCIQKNDLEAAKGYLNNALKIDAFDYRARMLDGALSIACGNYEQSIRSFRVALEERPASSLIHLNMAVAYICLNRTSKALTELKKAVALEPLNQNAVILLADLSFSLKSDQDAVPSLKLLLEYENKNPEIWSRLARALMTLGKNNEAISALKRQGSIEDNSDVWNNLGVCYAVQRNFLKAEEAFAYSVRKSESEESHVNYLSVRNLAQVMLDQRKYSACIKLTKSFIAGDQEKITLKDGILSDIWAFYIHSLWMIGSYNDSWSISEKLIEVQEISPRLKLWLVSSLIAHYGMILDDREKLEFLIEGNLNLVDSLNAEDIDRKQMFFNNVAYAYAELGDYKKAELYLRKISEKLHKHPFPTATLGLIHFRKGDIKSGEDLYSRAIHLAQNRLDKARIRQKLNYELARNYLENKEHSKARRSLQKVFSETGGSPEIIFSARKLEKRLLVN